MDLVNDYIILRIKRKTIIYLAFIGREEHYHSNIKYCKENKRKVLILAIKVLLKIQTILPNNINLDKDLAYYFYNIQKKQKN